MRALLLIFVFYVHYVICDEKKYAVKSYPKKVKSFGAGQILINSGKYVNSPKTTKPKTLATNIGVNGGKYTVFQIINHSQDKRGAPDSPYFAIEQEINDKPRVKKVLPDYVWSSLVRHKRSAETPALKLENKTDAQVTTAKPTGDSKVTKPNAESKITTVKIQNIATTKAKTKETKVAKKEETNAKKNLPSKRSFNLSKKAPAKKVPTRRGPVKKTPVKKGPAKKGPSKKGSPKKGPAKKGLSKKGLAKKSQIKGGSKGGKYHNKVKAKKAAKGVSKNSKLGARARINTKPKGKLTGRHRTPEKNLKARRTRQSKSKLVRTRPKSRKQSLRMKKWLKRSNTGKSRKQPMRRGKAAKSKIIPDTRRLTAAKEAVIEDYPYVVSIQKDEEHWCSGALLNPRLVITTANCVWKSKHISRMMVRAGSSYTDRGGQLAGIQEVMKHPAWGLRGGPDNDLALILLDQKLKFSHSIHAVDLPNSAMYPAFDDAWVASWGSERRDGVFDHNENVLQAYHTMVMNRDLCNNITARFGVMVTENFICLSQTGRTSPCTRDTGSPAVSDGILWGLASWGLRKLCGTERFPSMFSYLASHSNIAFISNATSYLMSEERLSPFLDRPLAKRSLA